MTKYELQSLDLPKLTGRPLQAFAAAMDNTTMRAMLLGRLLEQGGIPKLRDRKLDEAPTLYPSLTTPPAAERPLLTSMELLAQSAADLPARAGAVFATTADYAAAYRRGEATPPDVAQRVIDSIAGSDRGEKPLRLFIASDAQDVMRQAHAAAQRLREGRPLSIFDGVPVAVKDEIDMTPYPTTLGTSFLGKSPVERDSTLVGLLRAAGALLIGKANMHEIGINPNGLNVHHGIVRNPYHRDHDPGGSSSGPAAAVAAGLCPVAIGADGGGSIRVPAAHCGLVGLKATFGRISETGVPPLTWSMGHVGPIGATVADVALAYALIAGPDPLDGRTHTQPPVTLDGWTNTDLSGVRLGVYRRWFEHAAPEVVAANERVLGELIERGARLVEIEIPELDEMRIAHVVTILSEMVNNMDHYPENRTDFGPAVRINLALARAFTAADYVQAQKMRTRALRIFAGLFQKVDAVVSPTTAVTAPPIPANGWPYGWSDLSTETEVMRFVFPGNLTGLPAISFPAGYDSGGMPIGMQVMGRHWEENLLLRIAYAAEQVVERKRPSVFFDLLP